MDQCPVSIAKMFEFDSAHRLRHHKGKCRNLHGHTYKVEVTVEGSLITSGPASGMVVDFSSLSKMIKDVFYNGEWCGKLIVPFDHSVFLHKEDEMAKVLEENFPDIQIYKMTEEPTAEYLSTLIAGLLQEELKHQKISVVEVTKVTVWETPNSKAVYDLYRVGE